MYNRDWEFKYFFLFRNNLSFRDETYENIIFFRSMREAIPEISNGYYFFYDRHSEAADPFDESALWSRSSINCTLAIYDADEDIMYVLIKDT